ncbi:TPA: hypothetical protein N2299_001827 [Enterobacter hormaechei]|uniref:hypothetical protein n=1 Tax=Enterobacter cloacae complex TaxID=354276 RepID=UPI0005EF1061|nr:MULTISPECIES: hypothetical protein [Enterobacter cloacae complex]CAE6319828.1 hypothetical protein AI2716V1_0382 [Enterobacter cloacae]ELD3451351.1 hypothetical protein [Enterobacter hormaechei]KJO78498.1 hypothetical protein SR98_14005 [Enterobacter hormaechei subsp. xiangfangensis]KJP33671.1 hypothetical protein SR78_10100 [Enterobacter hormaechei subsp. xiangfangensis]KLQ76405.1 hypothetical protein ABF63_20790 [Enterobacter hormaechei subsp. steigerwaltii]
MNIEKHIQNIDINKKITVIFHDNSDRNRNVGVNIIINNNKKLNVTRDIGTAESILKSALVDTRGLKGSVRSFIKEHKFDNYIVMKNASVVAIMGVNDDCSSSVLRIGSFRGTRIKYSTLDVQEVSKNGSNQIMHYFGNGSMSFAKNVQEATSNIEESTNNIEAANKVISEEVQSLKEEIARLKAQLERPAAERFVEAAKELKETGADKQFFINIIENSFKEVQAQEIQETEIKTFIANKTKTSNGIVTMSMFEARDYHHLEEVSKIANNAGLNSLPEIFRITDGTKSIIVNKTNRTITKEQ